MRSKFVSLIAVLFLVAACETAPEDTMATAGEGASTGSESGSTMSSTETMAAGPMAGSQEDLVTNVGDRVFFDFDKAVLKPEAQRTLERQAAWMKQNYKVSITVEGHCDERGTREYNLALGERRATAVKNFLVALGIDPGRVSTISYGKERPAALGHTEAAWAQNRRGVTVVN